MVWGDKFGDDKIFIKCADENWVYFTEIATPFGKLKAADFEKKVLKKKSAKGTEYVFK